LLDEVVGLAERWLSMVGSSLAVGVLGMNYGDFEVAREVVKAYGSCGARSRERVLDNAIDILLVATALNRGYGFVTTDRGWFAVWAIESLQALAKYPGALCLGAPT
jgi:hypothetical protein